jgi:hypothetical protein
MHAGWLPQRMLDAWFLWSPMKISQVQNLPIPSPKAVLAEEISSIISIIPEGLIIR